MVLFQVIGIVSCGFITCLGIVVFCFLISDKFKEFRGDLKRTKGDNKKELIKYRNLIDKQLARIEE